MEFEIENGVLKKYNGYFGVTEVVIPNGITEIGSDTFRTCRKFASISKGITYLGSEIFLTAQVLSTL